MKNIFLVILLICLALHTRAQDNILLSQYLQNIPTLSPALTGANDFLDLRMGIREQWMGFEGAPRTIFISGYGALGNYKKLADQRTSVRTESDIPSSTVNRISQLKHGLGGNLLLDEQGPFQQMEINFNYAVHVPIKDRTYLSLGLSTGIYNAKVDFSKVIVNDLGDLSYDKLVKNGESSTFFQLSGGLALYSDRYYVAYSMMQLQHTLISGNELLNNDNQPVVHQVAGGYRFYLNQNFELMPNTFVRIEDSMPLLWDLGARVQYKGDVWLGASYRNDDSIIGMLGLLYKDKFRIGYAYDHKIAGVDNFNSGSHELVLGVQLFNDSRYVSKW